jgi:tetratricopeptide (TPR) repeat protein
LTKAHELCKQSLQIFEELKDLEGLSRAYINIAKVYTGQCLWDEAAEALQKSLALKQEVGDTFDQGRAVSHLGQLAFKQGNYQQAESLYQQSLTMWQQVGSAYLEATVLSNFGQLYLAQNNLVEAENSLIRSQTILAQVNSEKLLPELERRWAVLYLKQNQLGKALNHIDLSLQHGLHQANILEQAKSQRVLGQIRHAQGNYEQAHVALRQSFDTLTQISNDYELARTKLALAELYRLYPIESGLDKAYLEQAMTTFEHLGAKADLIHALAIKHELTA